MNKYSINKLGNSSVLNGWRTWLRICIHVASGALILFFYFPFGGQQSKNRHIKRWSTSLLDIFGIQLRVLNEQVLPPSPFLIVANHISWIDIHAINAFKPMCFVAKSEVESWPIFGWMAKQLGTIFIKRENLRHARQVSEIVSKALNSKSICIFPEGTSTDGEDVLPFKSNLFEAAIIANVPIYALAISYKSLKLGSLNKSPAFVGDMSLLQSMNNILNDGDLVVELNFISINGSSIDAPRDRKILALESQKAISKYLKSIHKYM